MSRSSVPFSMPSYHIQLKSTDRRSLAPAAGVYGAPAFGSALRPRPPPPPGAGAPARPCPAAGACCEPAVDATPIATTAASATSVQRLLRREFIAGPPSFDPYAVQNFGASMTVPRDEVKTEINASRRSLDENNVRLLLDLLDHDFTPVGRHVEISKGEIRREVRELPLSARFEIDRPEILLVHIAAQEDERPLSFKERNVSAPS